MSKISLIRDMKNITHPSWRIFWIWEKCKTNDLYPAFLWYFRYPKQERTKFFSQDFFCNHDFKIPHFGSTVKRLPVKRRPVKRLPVKRLPLLLPVKRLPVKRRPNEKGSQYFFQKDEIRIYFHRFDYVL